MKLFLKVFLSFVIITFATSAFAQEQSSKEFDEKVAKPFCSEMREQINELPLLDPATKQKFVNMLKDCAVQAKAENTYKDAKDKFKEAWNDLRNEIKEKTGVTLKSFNQ